MLPHRTRVDEGLDSHRSAIAALGLAVSRARRADAAAVPTTGGRRSPGSVRLTEAPKSPSRRRSRGRGDLRAVPPPEVAVLPLEDLAARRRGLAPRR